MKPRYHYEGRDDAGKHVFTECGSDRVMVVTEAEHGKPLPPGRDLVCMKPCEDKEHYEAETVTVTVNTDGPAQVASEEYRSGWDRIFKKELN